MEIAVLHLLVSQGPESGGMLVEFLQYGDLTVQTLMGFMLWKLWGLYREQQKLNASILKRLVDHATGTTSPDGEK